MSRLPLATLVQTAVDIALDLAADIVLQGTYRQPNTTTYNASTGAVTPGYVTASIGAGFLNFSQKETDGDKVKAGDKKALVKASELGAIVPNADDEFVEDGTGYIWQVIGIKSDPTKRLYTLHFRRIIK